MNYYYKSAFLILLVSLNCELVRSAYKTNNDDELWQTDLSDSMGMFEPSTEGLQRVHFKCGADSMHVELETEDEFTGVMYTRGSYDHQNGPCFGRGHGGRALSMKFPLNECYTRKNGEIFSNVVVVQHDPDLMTPGDAAFAVECDFRKPREIKVGADLTAEGLYNEGGYTVEDVGGSQISLVSPDPHAAHGYNNKRIKRDTFRSKSNTVIFVPERLRLRRDLTKKLKKTKLYFRNIFI